MAADDTDGDCVDARRRVHLLIDLREVEEAARLAQLRLQRRQDDQTVAACRDADQRTQAAQSMLVAETTPLEEVYRMAELVNTPSVVLRDAATAPPSIPRRFYGVVHAIDDKYLNRRMVRSDADADRAWAKIQAEYTEAEWNALLKRCIVPPMFGEPSPLQNLPGRTHLRVALVFCIHANGACSHRHGRLLPCAIRRAVLRLARTVRKCEAILHQ
jgi:hypothetical protein